MAGTLPMRQAVLVFQHQSLVTMGRFGEVGEDFRDCSGRSCLTSAGHEVGEADFGPIFSTKCDFCPVSRPVGPAIPTWVVRDATLSSAPRAVGRGPCMRLSSKSGHEAFENLRTLLMLSRRSSADSRSCSALRLGSHVRLGRAARRGLYSRSVATKDEDFGMNDGECGEKFMSRRDGCGGNSSPSSFPFREGDN